MNILIGYKKCSSCKKAELFLNSLNIKYTYREIDKDVPTYNEMKEWIKNYSISINKLFNTSGILYKSMNFKEKRKALSEDALLKELATNGLLIKRPILIYKNNIYIGKELYEINN